MRKLTFLLVASLLSASAHAAHTSAETYRNVLVGTTNHTVTFSTVLDHETLVVFFSDRTGGASITAIADSAGGTWTQRSDATWGGASNFLTRIYVREDAAAASNLVVTITTAASQNSQVVGRRIATDAGGTIYPTYDNVATVAVEAVNDADWDTNAVSVSAIGSSVGMMGMNNQQASTPTCDVCDDVGPAPPGGGIRSFSTFRAHGSSGSYDHQVTLIAASSGPYHLISFVDSAAASGNLLLRRRRN